MAYIHLPKCIETRPIDQNNMAVVGKRVELKKWAGFDGRAHFG